MNIVNGVNNDIPRKDFGATVEFPQDYPIPPVLPPKGVHPRIWIRSENLPTLRENLKAADNRICMEKVLLAGHGKPSEFCRAYSTKPVLPDTPWDGTMPVPTDKTYNYTPQALACLESRAFLYLAQGDADCGREAVTVAKNFLLTSVFTNDIPDVRYYAGAAMYILSEVYDWCYDLMTPADRENIVTGILSYLAPHFEIGVPPKGQGSVSGHGTGAQLLRNWLAFSIAVYDEHPEIYMNVVGRFYAEYIDAPNFYYPSGINFQGSAYGPGKTILNIVSELLITRMTGGQKLYDFSFAPVIEGFLSYIRPDGEAIRVGDDYNQKGKVYGMGNYRSLAFLGAALYGNSVYKAWANSLAGGFGNIGWGGELDMTPVTFLLLNDPTLPEGDKTALSPVHWQGSPTGAILARSAWCDPAAWLTHTKIGEAYAANHEHKDAGTFQVYYKGILAMTSSCYQYNNTGYGSPLDYGYDKQTVSKNGLLIYDPTEETDGQWLNSGGQRADAVSNGENRSLALWREKSTYRQAKTLAHASAVTKAGGAKYAYIAGDITNAYAPQKAKEIVRETLSLQTEDAKHPLVFAVYDRLTSTKAEYKKTFLLHCPEEPIALGGGDFRLTNTEKRAGVVTGGALDVRSLTPVTATLIGGHDRWSEVNGKNLQEYSDRGTREEIGWGRIELSPAVPHETDEFFTVMTAGDATDAPSPAPVRIETAEYIGALTLGKAFFFRRKAGRQEENFTLTLPEPCECYVTGLAAGEWQINGKNVTVTEEAGLAVFAAAGMVEIKRG